MVKSFSNYKRNIYCTKSRFFQYENLKEVTGKIEYELFPPRKEAIEVKDETCEDLIKQCQEKFGEEYQYIQSGQLRDCNWDTVKASDVTCQHLYATDHDYCVLKTIVEFVGEARALLNGE